MMLADRMESGAECKDFAQLEESSLACDSPFHPETSQEQTRKQMKKLKSKNRLGNRLPSLKLTKRQGGAEAAVSGLFATKTTSSSITKQTLQQAGFEASMPSTSSEKLKSTATSENTRGSAFTVQQGKRLTKVGSLRKRKSSKNKSSQLVDFHANRTTCSSALKVPMLSERTDLEGGAIPTKVSVKVCPYSYCSLHGSKSPPSNDHTPTSRQYHEQMFTNREEEEEELRANSMIFNIENAEPTSVRNAKAKISGKQKNVSTRVRQSRRDHDVIPKLAITSQEARDKCNGSTIGKYDICTTDTSEKSYINSSQSTPDSASNISMEGLPRDIHVMQQNSADEFNLDDLDNPNNDKDIDSRSCCSNNAPCLAPDDNSRFSDLSPATGESDDDLSDPEAEKVPLRHLDKEDRRKSEEWMLDYALQKVILSLTPPEKRKVGLIVQAFEAVIPEIGTTAPNFYGSTSSAAQLGDNSNHSPWAKTVEKSTPTQIPKRENAVNERSVTCKTACDSRCSPEMMDDCSQKASERSSFEKSPAFPEHTKEPERCKEPWI